MKFRTPTEANKPGITFPAEKVLKLTECYDKYIDLLREELNETASLCSIHGWVSQRYDAGCFLREEIIKARLELGDEITVEI